MLYEPHWALLMQSAGTLALILNTALRDESGTESKRGIAPELIAVLTYLQDTLYTFSEAAQTSSSSSKSRRSYASRRDDRSGPLAPASVPNVAVCVSNVLTSPRRE